MSQNKRKKEGGRNKKNERKGKHGVKLKTTYNFLLTVTTMDPNSWDESGWENGCLVLRKGISSEMLREHFAGGNLKPVRSNVLASFLLKGFS